MNEKETYQQKMTAQLDKWKADLDLLKAKADQMEAGAKLEYYKQLDALKVQQEKLKDRLTHLKHASEESWGDLKTGADGAWKEIDQAFKSIVSRFK